MKYYALAAAAAALSCSPAMAAVVVDTGAPQSGGGFQLRTGQPLAALFTLNSATQITSVEGHIGGVTANGVISIFTGGVDPASSGLLHSAAFSLAASGGGQFQGVFGQNWNLAAGQYWAVFSSNGENFMLTAVPNPLPQLAQFLPSSGTWTQLGGQLGIGVRIAGVPVVVAPAGAVPEPATWAMMLVGFGAMGGALRSRRRVALACV